MEGWEHNRVEVRWRGSHVTEGGWRRGVGMRERESPRSGGRVRATETQSSGIVATRTHRVITGVMDLVTVAPE